MKQTKGAIGNLLNRYKAVLKKCHLLNTFGSLAVAGMLVMGGAGVASAAIAYTPISGNVILSENMVDTKYIVQEGEEATIDLNGHSLTLGAHEGDNGVPLYSYGKLTLVDSVGNGYVSGATKGVVSTGEGGLFVLESGIVSSTGSSWAVQVQQQGSALIKGGIISGETSGLILITAGEGMTASATIEDGAIVRTTDTYEEGDASHVAVFLQPENEKAQVFLTVNGGTIESDVFAIAGNGTAHGTNITINGGTITSRKATAIYHPQAGTMTINGGTITGETGIELRSGTLNINGGTIRGVGDPFDTDPNGNGTTTIGAALAISQHTTDLDINVKIDGGTFEGYYALYEADLQNEKTDNIALEITNGTFNGKIYSENLNLNFPKITTQRPASGVHRPRKVISS